MMNGELEALTSGLDRAPGVALSEIQAVAATLNVNPPADYLEFMASSNGAEGALGDDGYLVIWPAEEIIDLNETYRIDEFAPGLVLFGGDGGNTGYAFDRRSGHPQIVSIPLMEMSLREVEVCGSTFADFLRYVARPQDT